VTIKSEPPNFSATNSSRPSEEQVMGKKVIVIDDSQTVRHQVATALRDAGFEIIEAVDGVDGLDVITRTPDAALVICDVNMPNRSGLELLDIVRKNEAFKSLPVLMLTTEGQPQLIERARKAGAKGWLVKPFRADLLLAAVKKLTA
jgi:two-component system, chemotaxis family, chemotaxis protein CheY